ncbi:MAG TPA: 2-oxoglutarate dehydrogenase E1 component, partial [Herbaspirillum sp.]|nr:2-oxoglutarate dehydrogenase E1 component [Herbaspirillum sp.]
RMFRKPLIIMTPKSLLRNKSASSPLSDLARGSFQTVIPEQDDKIDAKKVKRIIACSGKVYYDLLNARKERAQFDTAIIRVEQLYPFPHKAFAAVLKQFPNFQELVWTQDEPQNQGAWLQIQCNIFENLTEGKKLAYAGRPASASPAVGYYDKHYAQQKALIDSALSKLKGFVLTK